MSSRERPESEARKVRHQKQQAAAQKRGIEFLLLLLFGLRRNINESKIEGGGYEGGM